MADLTCDYGYPVPCGKTATWSGLPDKFPTTLNACDDHAPLMFEAEIAHRFSWAPPLPLPVLKEYVTACAWRSVLLRDTSNKVRAENAHYAFSNALAEYRKRGVV